jgi:putative transposase
VKTRKAYKFRIFPTKAQQTKLEATLRLCRELYNAALQERRDAYKMVGKSLNYYDQANQLAEIKEERTDLKDVHSQVLQDVLKRVDKAFQGFFSRVKTGKKAGFPRFQGRNRYDSFTYPQGGWSIKNDKLTVSKIGTIRIKLHREVMGKVKTCTIHRDGLNWFVCFSVEYEFEQPVHEGPAIGIDVGLENFANLSNGEQVANPRLFRKSEKHLAKVQRKLAKLRHLPRTDRSKVIAKRSVTRALRKVKNQRLDFAHKISHKLSKEYSLIAVEDLNIKGLASGMLAKSVNDASWSLFLNLLSYKVENTGSKLVKVDPRYTSQTCPDCGNIRKKDLSERWHSCECGSSMHRDVAAAKVILSRGLATLGNQSVDAPAFRRGV